MWSFGESRWAFNRERGEYKGGAVLGFSSKIRNGQGGR